MYQSTGQETQGTLRSYGLFDECVDTQGPNSTDGSSILFNGQYCSVFFNLEVVRPDELDNRTILNTTSDLRQQRTNWIT